MDAVLEMPEVPEESQSAEALAAKAVAEWAKVRKAFVKGLQHTKATGDYLNDCKAAVIAEGGQWMKWADKHIDIPASSRSLAMRISSEWETLKTLTDIEHETVRGARSALTALEGRSKPRKAAPLAPPPDPTADAIAQARTEAGEAAAITAPEDASDDLTEAYIDAVESRFRSVKVESVPAERRHVLADRLRDLLAAIGSKLALLEGGAK